MDASLFGDLEDQCTCWVCFELFKEPTTLNCGHSFCKSCANAIVQKNPICPFCRRAFEPPLPDVNQDLVQLVSTLQLAKDAEGPPYFQPQESWLLQLPDEALVELLSYLPAKSLCRTSAVCRQLHSVADDAWLWRPLCQSTFPFCSIDKYGRNWKKCYIGRSKVAKGWEGGKAGDFDVTSLRGHTNYVNCFSLYRNNIVSGAADSTVKIWKVSSDEPVHSLPGHQGTINCLQFNEMRIASGSADQTVCLWDAFTGLCFQTFRHNGAVTGLQFNDRVIVSASEDRSVRVWDLQNGSCQSTFQHNQGLQQVEFDATRIVSAGRDSVKVWDMRTGALLRDFVSGTPTGFHTIGSDVIVAYSDGRLVNWSVTTGAATVFGGGQHARAVSQLTSNGEAIVSASIDGSIKVWDLATKQLKHTFSEHNAAVNSVQVSGNKIVSGASDNTIKVWDLKRGRQMYALLGGSLQQRANNPAHPSKPGCSHVEIDDSRIIGSFASLLRIYDFEVAS
eukprot:TRINITY_DN18930_c0_g1_i1.p1 TRINITY_DN18930_c0_g1~~TRINITY_DN18930_c0_g1_i1.p1  ORF type:complete len:504 (+),score=22.01 TRINITY_DN18930_c0_g1_i1:175-1686(+)